MKYRWTQLAMASALRDAVNIVGEMIKGNVTPPEGVTKQDLMEVQIELGFAWEKLRVNEIFKSQEGAG